ncbi:MAG: 50S ribosomal protein L15 [Kiritimatiellae bacterium]|nr:50S ribosomal protein L15 [Kiritimatiellia bacterium]
MNLHTLTNTEGARHRKNRVGRGMGSGNGKTCGRGHKGQMSRKGANHKPGFEGGQMRLIRRLPKRGFHNATRKTFVPVNVGLLSCFDDGVEVTSTMLREGGFANGPGNGIKILGNGKLDKKLTVKVAAFSAAARDKIESAGGACEVIKEQQV